jgi:hypothetical protein
MQPTKRYYAFWLRLNNEDLYTIWYSNNKDGFLLEESNRIPVFRTMPTLLAYADRQNVSLEDEVPELHNFDLIKLWIRYPTADTIVYDVFLNALNAFGDIASSIGNKVYLRLSKHIDRIYQKLFWGCNLPAVTPRKKVFHPLWNQKELEKLQAIFDYGLKMLQDNIVFA